MGKLYVVGIGPGSEKDITYRADEAIRSSTVIVGYSKYNELITYLNINRLSDGSITAANRNGVSTGFLVSGTEIPWEYGKRQHLGATAWLAFAQLGKNPFDF